MTPSAQRCAHIPVRENNDTADFVQGVSCRERQLYWKASGPAAGVATIVDLRTTSWLLSETRVTATQHSPEKTNFLS